MQDRSRVGIEYLPTRERSEREAEQLIADVQHQFDVAGDGRYASYRSNVVEICRRILGPKCFPESVK